MKHLILLALLATLALAAPAAAQESSQSGYGGQAGETSSVGDPVSANAPDNTEGSSVGSGVAGAQDSDGGDAPRALASTGNGNGEGGSLPFTGFEALIVALGGAALLTTGLAVRRLSRPNA